MARCSAALRPRSSGTTSCRWRPRARAAARRSPSRRRRSRARRSTATSRRAAARAVARVRAVEYRPARVAKEEKVEFEGEVVEALPNAMFRVQLDNGHTVLGHVAGKMRRFRIRILPGDRVRVELSPYDLDRARIVYRHR